MGHALQAQGIEDGFQNGQAGREDRPAVRLEALEIDLLDAVQLEQAALEPVQPLGVHLAAAALAGLDDLADGADGAGGADRLLPAVAAQAGFDAHQFQTCGSVGLGVTGRADPAVGEKLLGEADAAHLQAFPDQRFEALADDEFRAAATDIGDQAVAVHVGEGVRHAEIDQARLLDAGHHFDRVPEQRFGAADEQVAVARHAQRVGADDAHRALRQAVNQLGETRQAVEAALHGFLGEVAAFIEAGGQLNLVTQTLENADLALIDACQHHMEAVRPQIDGGNQGELLWKIGHKR